MGHRGFARYRQAAQFIVRLRLQERPPAGETPDRNLEPEVATVGRPATVSAHAPRHAFRRVAGFRHSRGD
jgi:hypothetical protein